MLYVVGMRDGVTSNAVTFAASSEDLAWKRAREITEKWVKEGDWDPRGDTVSAFYHLFSTDDALINLDNIADDYISGCLRNLVNAGLLRDLGEYEMKVDVEPNPYIDSMWPVSYEIQYLNNKNWEPIPDGEFTDIRAAKRAMRSSEQYLEWRDLRIVRVTPNGKEPVLYGKPSDINDDKEDETENDTEHVRFKI